MWLRQAFYRWLLPAALVLPLWLLIGWGVFNAGGWAFLWVLFIAIPSVLVGQLVLTLLVRARGTVRAERAVSWGDVVGFTAWHGLTIALGFYDRVTWVPLFVLAILVGIGMFWFTLWELLRETRPSRILLRTSGGVGFIPPERPEPRADVDPDVIIITERRTPPAA